MGHTLVIYKASERADAALAELARAARQRGGRLTVVALAVEEPVGRGCCDTRSVLWNGIQREFAQNDLARARMAIEDVTEAGFGAQVHDGRGTLEVGFEVLGHRGRRVDEAVEREARRRGVSEIVIADPRACGLSRLERRRLQAAWPSAIRPVALRPASPG